MKPIFRFPESVFFLSFMTDYSFMLKNHDMGFGLNERSIVTKMKIFHYFRRPPHQLIHMK